MEIIAQGAESIIRTDNKIVVKERLKKTYRHSDIDDKLRKQRTRKEAKIIQKLNKLIPTPKLLEVDDKNMIIKMDFIDGDLVKDILDDSDYKVLCETIGKQLALIHDNDIVHGDLTTSNMILADNKLHFIDFGLSIDSHKIEDKAVDLYLLKQAFNSRHFRIADVCFDAVIHGYKSSKQSKEILERLSQVELRGRNKKK